MSKTFWLESLKQRHHLKTVGPDGKIILQWIFENWVVKNGLD
jgi:hypothetical protein